MWVGIIYMEGVGINKAISMSNTKNNTAKIKNRSENGMRAELWGSNPHSKGVDFSLFVVDFFLKNNVVAKIVKGKIQAINMIRLKIIIFLGCYTC